MTHENNKPKFKYNLWLYAILFLTLLPLVGWWEIYATRNQQNITLQKLILITVLNSLGILLFLYSIKVIVYFIKLSFWNSKKQEIAKQQEIARVKEEKRLAEEKAQREYSLEVRGIGVQLEGLFNLNLLKKIDEEKIDLMPDFLFGYMEKASPSLRVFNATTGWSAMRMAFPIVAVVPDKITPDAVKNKINDFFKSLKLQDQTSEKRVVNELTVFNSNQLYDAILNVFELFEKRPQLPAVILWIEGADQAEDIAQPDFSSGILFSKTEILADILTSMEAERVVRDPRSYGEKVTRAKEKPPLTDRSWWTGNLDEALVEYFKEFISLPIIAHLHRPLQEKTAHWKQKPMEAMLGNLLATLPQPDAIGSVLYDMKSNRAGRIAWLRELAVRFPDLDTVNLGLDNTYNKKPIDMRPSLLLALAILRVYDWKQPMLGAFMDEEHGFFFAVRPAAVLPEANEVEGESPAHVTRCWLDEDARYCLREEGEMASEEVMLEKKI